MVEVDGVLESLFDDESAGSTDRQRVIVSLESGTSREHLTDLGMEVAFMTRDGSIAAGTIDRPTFERLKEESSVIRLESDGEMRALD